MTSFRFITSICSCKFAIFFCKLLYLLSHLLPETASFTYSPHALSRNSSPVLMLCVFSAPNEVCCSEEVPSYELFMHGYVDQTPLEAATECQLRENLISRNKLASEFRTTFGEFFEVVFERTTAMFARL